MVKYIKNHIPIKKHQRPGTKSKKNSITIHSTRNTAPAINERNNLARKDNTRTASFHIAVDHNQAIECIPLDEISYHAGNREGNNTSISIEMCEIPGKLDLVIENTIEVTKKIMAEYNIPADKVVRHFDWPQKNTSWRKPCPYILSHNNWQGWKDFKEKLKITKTPILGKSTSNIDQMQAWAKNKNAHDKFIELAPVYYRISKEAGVNPIVSYTQSAKETGYFKFGGVLDISFKNPCGMKVGKGGHDLDPNAHKRFKSWEEGIQAQVDHLALYAGAKGYPKKDTPDPRHFSYLHGKAKTVESLGGYWAPSKKYGTDIVKMMKDLESTPYKKKHWAEKHWDSLKRKGIKFDEKRFNDTVTRGELFAALDKSLK